MGKRLDWSRVTKADQARRTAREVGDAQAYVREQLHPSYRGAKPPSKAELRRQAQAAVAAFQPKHWTPWQAEAPPDVAGPGAFQYSRRT